MTIMHNRVVAGFYRGGLAECPVYSFLGNLEYSRFMMREMDLSMLRDLPPYDWSKQCLAPH